MIMGLAICKSAGLLQLYSTPSCMTGLRLFTQRTKVTRALEVKKPGVPRLIT